MSIDISVLINWIVSGFIGTVFGIFSAWVAYRYERRRDDILWEREKEKLQQQFEHDRQLLEAEFQQRLQELERQLRHQEGVRLQERLTEGIDNAAQTIENLQRAQERIRGVRIRVTPEQIFAVAGLLAQAANQLRILQDQWQGVERFVSPQLVQMLMSAQHSLQQIAERFLAADQELSCDE